MTSRVGGSGQPAVDWRAEGDRLRNWGRWGTDDQLGTLNHITPDVTLAATKLPATGEVISLSTVFDAYGPHSAGGFRRNPIHLMTVDGGDIDLFDRIRGWGGPTEQALQARQESSPLRFADDFIMMPLQAATHWDALSHVYYDRHLYNGVPAEAITSFGATRNSIDEAAVHGIVTRGLLFDVAAANEVEYLEPGYAIGPEELDAFADEHSVEVRRGDVVLVRTGAMDRFTRSKDPAALYGPSPGLSWRCAGWAAKHEIAAFAADNIAVDVSPSEIPNVNLPLHLIGLRDMGLMLGELWDFSRLAPACARLNRYEFLLVAQPLRFAGAAGSPLNPTAIL